MIKRLLVLSLLLEIIFLSSAFVLMITRTGDCDLPGLYGIMPGQTTQAEAINIIAALPQERLASDDSGAFYFNNSEGTRSYAGLVHSAMPSPNEIVLALSTLNLSKPNFSLGTFIDHGCQPNHVYRAALEDPDPVSLFLTFGQDNRLALLISADKSVNAASRVYWIWMLPAQDNQEIVDDIRDQFSSYDEVRWLGYASDYDYWAEAPIQ